MSLLMIALIVVVWLTLISIVVAMCRIASRADAEERLHERRHRRLVRRGQLHRLHRAH